MLRKRARDLGIIVGEMSPGPLDAITDIQGVRVGHTTLISGEGPLTPGAGPIRTGVTVVLPHGDNIYRRKVRAAVHTINGYGKVCGFEQVRELGLLEAPIALTSTLNLGLVLDAMVQESILMNPDIGINTSSVNVVVGETNDGYLNDIQGRHVRAEHVWSALRQAGDGPVPMGAVGAGTGTICYGWKGGIGTASRVLPENLGGFTLGVLVQTNFGQCTDLRVCGVPVGRLIDIPPKRQSACPPEEQGSVMIILASDAPLGVNQLHRLCIRAAAGLARTGSVFHHGSGDFVIAFSTAHRVPHQPEDILMHETIIGNDEGIMNGLFRAVIEGVEQAVLESLVCADTMIGRDGHVAYGLPIDQVLDILHRSQQCYYSRN